MKKIIIVVSFVCAFGYAAQAEYLYWQLSDTAAVSAGDETSLPQYSYASVKYTEGSTASDGTALQVADEAGATINGATFVAVDQDNPQQVVINLDQVAGEASAYSYYVEYYNYNSANGVDNWNSVGTSEAKSYGELLSEGAIYTGDAMQPITEVASLQMWTGGSFAAANPEPTTGILVLLGVTILGLKRKKANG